MEGTKTLSCTDQEYYDGLVTSAATIETIDIEEDLVAFPTNKPLSADF